MLEFYLRDVFDVYFEVIPLVKSRGIPGQSRFPAMQIPVEGKALGHETAAGQQLEIGGIIQANVPCGVEPDIGFDPRTFACRCCR